MKYLPSSGSIRRRPSPISVGSLAPVKLENEFEEENAPLNKRMKQSSFSDQWNAGNDLFPIAPSQYNPLAEPSPLGLRLKKSPSLLELIQMTLSQGDTDEKAAKATTAPPISNDKLKASNFPASLLRIGQWEYVSQHEGDLVAKCYFAKHKLVWEVLEGGLKSKIEIQWSDIMGLNAKFPEDGPATMTVVLARPPVFFRETNPQPRKHTLWQATTDFTDGQASIHRQHFVQVPLGILNKHFEKLVQCDTRLNYLSHQPEMVINSPYFDSLSPALEEAKKLQFHLLDLSTGANTHASSDGCTPSVSQTSSVTSKQESLPMWENLSHEAPSPSSGPENLEQLIMQGLRPSMSMTDLVNHIGTCMSGQGANEIPSFPEEGSESRKTLEDIAQHLLGDSQHTTFSDEKSLMSRVNSLCSLLHKDGTPVQLNSEKGFGGGFVDQKEDQVYGWGTEANATHEKLTKGDILGSEGDSMEISCKGTMSRKDSYGDLLHNLPRIASLPKFLFNISEDSDNRAR